MIIIDQYLSVVDTLVFSGQEFLKFAILETYLLLGQLIDSVFAILLYLFFDIKNFFTLGNKTLKTAYSKDLNQILDTQSGSDSDSIMFSQIDTVSDISCASYLQKRKKCGLVKFILKTIMKLIFLPIYILFRPKPPPNNALSNQKTSVREKEASGLLEDFCHNILEFVDIVCESICLVFRFRIFTAISKVYHGIGSCFGPSSFTRNYDDRPISELVQSIGYPYERILCETEDGYLLHTDRLVRRKTKDVLLFVHGITDSAVMWLGGDSQRSLACRSYEKGFDVFLLNFRGCGGSLMHKDKSKMKTGEFWDFNLNDLSFKDMRAAVKTIVEVKQKELGQEQVDIRLQIIAHSMGGGMTMGYIIHSKLHEYEHHIKRVILLAPCGIHREMPIFWKLFSNLLLWYCWIFRASYLGLHSESVRKVFAKFAQDLIGRPGARSVISMVMMKFMVGGRAMKCPLFHVHNICYHMLNGVSYGVLSHFTQLMSCGNFQSYDYGKKKNLEEYNSEKPIHFFDHYGKIDVPVVVISGEDDRIIPSLDVKRHYIQLIKSSSSNLNLNCSSSSDENNNNNNIVHKYRMFPNAGHLDLSWSMSEEMLKYLEEEIIKPFFDGEYQTKRRRRSSSSSESEEMSGEEELLIIDDNEYKLKNRRRRKNKIRRRAANLGLGMDDVGDDDDDEEQEDNFSFVEEDNFISDDDDDQLFMDDVLD